MDTITFHVHCDLARCATNKISIPLKSNILNLPANGYKLGGNNRQHSHLYLELLWWIVCKNRVLSLYLVALLKGTQMSRNRPKTNVDFNKKFAYFQESNQSLNIYFKYIKKHTYCV